MERPMPGVLRTTELIAPEWSDIDSKKAQANIAKTITQELDEPWEIKTAVGHRITALLPPVIEVSRLWEMGARY